MFEKITPANWQMFAMKHYDNPQADGEEEFQDDLKRFKYLKRLLKKYHEGGELKERLILNHIIVLTNVFGVEASVTLLERLESQWTEATTEQIVPRGNKSWFKFCSLVIKQMEDAVLNKKIVLSI